MFGNRENIPLTLLKKDDSLALKGIALLFLLGHHLFYLNDGRYDDIPLWKGHYLVQEIGIMSKVCVALFVFLSGYGLAVVAQKNGGVPRVKEFYIRRFKKLFLNYWFIWIVFVPISYFYFGRTFQDAYQNNIVGHFVADVLGLHALIFKDVYCYNPTWWFYSCIIVLYLIFPLMYKMLKKDLQTLLLLTFIISFLPIPFISVVKFYIVAFVLGMYIATKIPPSNSTWFAIMLVVLYAAARNVNAYPLMIDCLLVLLVVQVYSLIKWPKSVVTVMVFLGKHSMNIFLFHTFIYYYWFRDFIYTSRNPIIIFLTLLVICIPISMLLEWVKKYTIYKI